MGKQKQLRGENQKKQDKPKHRLEVVPSDFREVTAEILDGATDVFRKKGHLDPAFYILDGKGKVVAIATPPMNDPIEKMIADAGVRAVAAKHDAKAILAVMEVWASIKAVDLENTVLPSQCDDRQECIVANLMTKGSHYLAMGVFKYQRDKRIFPALEFEAMNDSTGTFSNLMD